MGLLGVSTLLAALAAGVNGRAAGPPAARDTDSLIDCLHSSLSPEGSVYLRGDDRFANATVRWNRNHQPTFAVVAAVANEQDVKASVCTYISARCTQSFARLTMTGTCHLGFLCHVDRNSFPVHRSSPRLLYRLGNTDRRAGNLHGSVLSCRCRCGV